MSQKYEKLKTLLMELFQLDQPDLDFGLYRIMHAKAGEVTQFLDKDLLPQVRAAFALYQPADRVAIEKELARSIEQAQALGAYPETLPKVKELREKLANDAVDVGALESEVYDHLFSFFRRYYSEGDFLAKRVYKPGVYAIPYEGEEVTLYWANKDQYYIKTSEYLRDYAFRLRPDDDQKPMRVHFRLADVAEGEHGNVKAAEGKDRVFILAAPGESGRDFIAEENGELSIRFEYRPATLTDWPEDEREGRTRPPAQKDLTPLAVQRVLASADAELAPWISELGKPHVTTSGEKADYTRLEAHLRRYTARNTFDYFIHKDLGAFLRRELDFYIKNEVMHLDDVEDESAPKVEQYLSKIKVIRKIAGKIIAFLAQLEDFQKKLWLKKKFVVETQYCITLDRIPEEFYQDIAANDAQREEWVRLFAIDEVKGDMLAPGYSAPLIVTFLKVHPTLVVDTRHFDAGFTARLLEAIGDLDEQTDGVLFHSENFQALALLRARYREQMKCIYIDPPYNTGQSEIAYKNAYRDSCWLSLMCDRLDLSLRLLHPHSCYAIAIDDLELARLCEVVDSVFVGFDRNMVVVNHHPQGGMSHNVSRTHEYMLMLTPWGRDILKGKNKSGEIEYRSFMLRQGSNELDSVAASHARKCQARSVRSEPCLSGPGDNKSRTGRPNSFYALLVDDARNKIVGIEPPPGPTGAYPTSKTSEGYSRRYPTSPSGEEKVWCRSYESAVAGLAAGEIVMTESGAFKLAVDTRGKRGSLMSNWTDSRYNAGPHGTALVAEIIGDREAFSYPKSIYTVTDALEAMTYQYEYPTILDYFAGSGTTGHAVIKLNREDGGRRKFILVEMGDYFDTVLLPRIKKVTFTPEWKDGKPKRLATPEEAERSPRIVKVIRLESYEDALNNLDLRRTQQQQSLLDLAEAQGADGLKEQYILRYLLDVETHGSQSLLNIAAFADPTAYKLKVKRPGSDESHEVNVDLLETFNYLIGLTVQHIAAPRTFTAEFERDGEQRLRLKGRLKQDVSGPYWFRTVTGTTPDGRKTLVIWRKRPGGETAEGIEQDNLVLDEWFTRQGYSARDSEFDLIYVNGDNNLDNLKAPDDTWKVRLIEEDFHRLMFDTEGA